MNSAQEASSRGLPVSFKSICEAIIKGLERELEIKESNSGAIPSLSQDVLFSYDYIKSALTPGVTLVGGKGATDLVLGIAAAAVRERYTVAILDSVVSVNFAERLLCSLSNHLPLTNLHKATLSDTEWQSLTIGMARANEGDVQFISTVPGVMALLRKQIAQQSELTQRSVVVVVRDMLTNSDEYADFPPATLAAWQELSADLNLPIIIELPDIACRPGSFKFLQSRLQATQRVYWLQAEDHPAAHQRGCWNPIKVLIGEQGTWRGYLPLYYEDVGGQFRQRFSCFHHFPSLDILETRDRQGHFSNRL